MYAVWESMHNRGGHLMDRSNSRVVDVVNLLATYPAERFSLSQIASRLGLSHGSAHRVLTTLTEAGYVSRHPRHKTFSLGLALVMIGQAALSRHRSIDAARHEMRLLAQDLKAQCTASAVLNDELILVAKEGTPQTHEGVSRIGERRAFIPPVGLAHVAWAPRPVRQAYLARLPQDMQPALAEHLLRALPLIRSRGYTIAANGPNQTPLRKALLIDIGARRDDTYWSSLQTAVSALTAPEIQAEDLEAVVDQGAIYISAPVFGPDGEVELELTLSGLQPDLDIARIKQSVRRLCAAAAAVTAESHGRCPQ